MRPTYVQLAYDADFIGDHLTTMRRFAGRPLDVIALIKTGIDFKFTRVIEGQSNDFVEISDANYCECR